jgi:hypothetical protein
MVRLRPSGRIVSWGDMQEIAGDDLYLAATALRQLRYFWSTIPPEGDSAFSSSEPVLSQKHREDAWNTLAFAKVQFLNAGLANSVAAIDELYGLLRSWTIPAFSELKASDAIARLDELERAVRRELRAVPVMFMSIKDAELYKNPIKDWEQVIQRWDKTKTDIEEAARCYACNRYAAAIFHALLVAEFGVIKVAELLGVAGDKPGWSCVERLQKIIAKKYEDRTPLEQQHSNFLRDTMPLIAATKDWRHKITHVDNRLIWLDTDWSPQRAEEIMVAARALMRHISKEMP